MRIASDSWESSALKGIIDVNVTDEANLGWQWVLTVLKFVPGLSRDMLSHNIITQQCASGVGKTPGYEIPRLPNSGGLATPEGVSAYFRQDFDQSRH